MLNRFEVLVAGKDNFRAWKNSRHEFSSAQTIIDALVLAPSSHNSQPWLIKKSLSAIEIHPNFERALPHSDPNHRQLYISNGAAAFTAECAARRFGFTPVTEIQSMDHVVVINLQEGYETTEHDLKFYEAIERRVTNRNEHTTEPLPDEIREVIESLSNERTEMSLIEENKEKEDIADLVEEGMGKVMMELGFTSELGKYLLPNDTDRYYGMPGFGFRPQDEKAGDMEAMYVPDMIRARDLKIASEVAKKDKDLISEKTAAIVVISTESDTPDSWIEAGKKLQELSLRATLLGMAVHPYGVLIENDQLNSKLRQIIGTEYRPQVMVRLGYPSKSTPHSPRIPSIKIGEVGFGEERSAFPLERPGIYSLIKGKYELEDLLEELGPTQIRDRYKFRLAELFEIRNGGVRLNTEEGWTQLKNYMVERDNHFGGKWIYLPWAGLLTHELDHEEFYEVLFSRNIPVIPAEVQANLRQMSAAVVGMSVGKRIAMGLAEIGLENFVLTDFDRYAQSNLPRAGVSLLDLDQPKVYTAAQSIWNLNPYANVRIYPEGINDLNRETIIRSVQIPIDHMSNIQEKKEVRREAHKQGKVVIMATDVPNPIRDFERPGDPMFGGRADAETLRKLDEPIKSAKDFAIAVVRIVGMDNMTAGQLANFNNAIEGTQAYASQTAISANAAVAMIQEDFKQIAFGNMNKIPTFRKMLITPSELDNEEAFKAEREKFEKLTGYRR